MNRIWLSPPALRSVVSPVFCAGSNAPEMRADPAGVVPPASGGTAGKMLAQIIERATEIRKGKESKEAKESKEPKEAKETKARSDTKNPKNAKTTKTAKGSAVARRRKS